MYLQSLLAVLTVLSISPLIDSQLISPFPGNYVFIITIGLMLIVHARQLKLPLKQSAYFCSLFLASAVLSLYWQESKLATLPVYFALGVLGVSVMTNNNKIIFVTVMTNILLVLLAGAFVGFIYALNGGEALVSFNNPDGRPNYFFLTTLSNAVMGNFIRPSGLFDEPGTFSFFICVIAAVRNSLSLSKRKTWILLIGGLITFSLAHVVYLIFHALSEKIFSKAALMVVLLISIFTSFIFLNSKIFEAADALLFSRLSVGEDGFAGDNRTDLFKNAFDNLTANSLVFGVDSICITDNERCRDQYGMMGENPLGPVAKGGILGSMPYYIITILLFFNGIKKKRNLVFVGLAFLLLQRPYVMSFGYAFLIYFAYNLSVDAKFTIKAEV